MNTLEFLSLVRKEIKYVYDRDEIEKELLAHIQDSIEDYMDGGMSYEEAQLEAVAQMGDPSELGKMLNQVHHPLIGYLYKFTQIILVILILPVIFYGGHFVYSTASLLFPYELEDSVEVVEIGIEFDTATHHIKVDNFCVTKDNQVHITYRQFRKLYYSRAPWHTDEIFLFSRDDQLLDFSGSRSSGNLGQRGEKEFEWPEDDILVIMTDDNQKIELYKGDYFDD